MTMTHAELFKRAQRCIPGGVNSPVRAFQQVGMQPLFAAHAKGAQLTDSEGKTYLDYMGAWGPMILGHAHPTVEAAVIEALPRSYSYGLATAAEVEMAELLTQAYPSMEMVRLTNSGTEATMTAIRLARGVTKKAKIIKFEGCYHGHFDSLLVKAGSGLATHASTLTSAPSSAGLIKHTEQSTIVLPFNDVEQLQHALANDNDIAAIILEPVVGNMGCVPPLPNYLSDIRRLCDQYQVLLIIDEVMTGFRLAWGGAQQRYHVSADLTTLGKIIGGGLPVGALGGKRQWMQALAPLGPVYQAGTLAGNPISVAAGLATLKTLQAWRAPTSQHHDAYDYLESLGQQLENQLRPLLQQHAEQICLQRVGSMFTLFFAPGPIRNWQESATGDHSAQGPYAHFFKSLLSQGVLFPPSSYEAAFISLAHTKADIEFTATAMQKAITSVLSQVK